MRIGSKKLRLNEDAHFRKGQFFYKEGLPFSNFKFRGQSTTNHRPKKKPPSELAIIHAEINDNRSPNNSPPISDLSLHVTSLNLAKGKGHE